MKKQLNVPKFKTEDEERHFWSKIDLTDYFESTDFESVVFPNLKPTSHPISIRIPDHILARLKEQANGKNIPYQSLIKYFISEGLSKDKTSAPMAR